MVILGGSREGPRWLGRHLTRTDTNERVEVLELQSPHESLTEAFRDWQAIAAGTRGTKGLYHANIDPAIGYAMTREQWWRSVAVLEQELGLGGQARAVVLHKKHGREHLHVVWARADLATMTLRSDSNNFAAHERASFALEREFGHEHVPGKHAKRICDRQQAPPSSVLNHAEWQQAERTGLDPRAVRAEIAELFRQSDNGQAFGAACEDSGYVLAQGDSRDFVIVDAGGGIHALRRSVKGLRAAEERAFMTDIVRDDLPTVEEARARQESRMERPEPPSAVVEDLRQQLAARHAQDLAGLAALHAVERSRRVAAWQTEMGEKLGHLDAMHGAALARYDREAATPGLVEKVRGYFDSAWAREQAEARGGARGTLAEKLAGRRAEETARLETARDLDLADLAERHAQQLREREARFTEDCARRLAAQGEHRRRMRQLEAGRPQEERSREDREGPDPPTRAR